MSFTRPFLLGTVFFLTALPCSGGYHMERGGLQLHDAVGIKKVKSSMARSSQWRIYYHRMWVQVSTTCSIVLKQPNGQLIVAVNHNQLRTIASERVDPIDWSHPPPSWAVSPERLVHSINQCNVSGTGTCNRSFRGNHLAYAATQGMKL